MTNARPNIASPWVIDIRAVGLTRISGAGIAHPLDITAPAPEHTLSGVLAVDPKSQVTLSGLAEAVAEGVMISAEVTATATGTCARCLTDIELELDAEVRELYAYPDSFTAATTDEDEIPRIDDELIDLEPAVHDELVLAMPAIPLCREDCPGLCPDCGQPMDSVGDDHRHEILDPRWAGLHALLDPTDSDPAVSNPADLNTAVLNPAHEEQ